MEKFKDAYNADLANGLGNLAARIMQLAETNLPEPVNVEAAPLLQEFTSALDSYDFNAAFDYVWGRIQALDRKVSETEPVKVVKVDADKGKKLIGGLVTELAAIDQMLEPLIPSTSGAIITAIMANKKPDNLFPRKE